MATLKWKGGNIRSKLDKEAVLAGKDSDGSLIYVGKAVHGGVCLPAKIIPSKQACYIAFNGVEVLVENFEVLCEKENKLSWEPASNGKVAAGAISTGRDGNDEIFIGRAPFQGSMTVGKVHPSHGCLYIPFGGIEHRVTNYEVLVYKKPKLQWVNMTAKNALPKDAVVGGRDTDGSLIYVGRAQHEGDLLPCKVLPSKQVGYVSYNGSEISKQSFEILVGNDVKWKREKDGKIPKGAIPGGKIKNGETLYIGRVEHNRSVTIGKIHQSHGCVYIPYGGQELSFKQYEVLTQD